MKAKAWKRKFWASSVKNWGNLRNFFQINRICSKITVELMKIVKNCQIKKVNSYLADKALLLRYLKTCHFDHEKAKDLLVLNLEFRKKYPQLFTNRDVNSAEIHRVNNTMWVNHVIIFNFSHTHYRLTAFLPSFLTIIDTRIFLCLVSLNEWLIPSLSSSSEF